MTATIELPPEDQVVSASSYLPTDDRSYDISAVPTVARFMASNTRHRLLMGPIGSGKSVGCVMDIVQRAARQQPGQDGIRRSRWAIVRNTYKQLEDTTIKTWLDWFPAPMWGKMRHSANNYDMMFSLDDGTIVEAEIRFRALDRPDQVVNLLSAEYTGAWFNEARHIMREIWEGMDGRIGRYPARKDGGVSWMGILLDTNPPDEDHWIYEIFEEKRPDICEAFYQPSGLSPEAENISNLPEGYYENIVKTKDDFHIHVYVHGRYGYLRDGKPVYPEYNDNVHCSGELQPLPGLPLHIGVDFGLTPACVICQVSPDGRLLVLDEVVSTRSGIKQFVDAVRDKLARDFPGYEVADWYCDPAGQQGAQTDMKSPFDVMIEAGIFPVKGEQDLDVRLEAVKQLLTRMVDGKPAIVISHRCKTLRKGFSGHYKYRRMQTSVEKYTDKPDKTHPWSDIHDGLQYLATRLFGVFMSGEFTAPPRVKGLATGTFS
jgi:hypothetical protein